MLQEIAWGTPASIACIGIFLWGAGTFLKSVLSNNKK